MGPGNRDVRVCVFGDSLVAGVGDPKALGWVGRVAARTTLSDGASLTAYPLGVNGEATEEVVVRVPMESAPRFARGDEHRVVLSTGLGDAMRGVDPLRSAAALEFGLQSVSVPTLVVGPPPLGDERLRAKLGQLDAGFGGVCSRLSVPYISTFQPLAAKARWDEARAADGVHPDQAGYGMLAYLVLGGGWRSWLGAALPPPR